MIYTFLLPDNSLISFDSVTEFSESMSASVTSYEVEAGFPISDNMVLSNPKFTINGILSYYNSPKRELILRDGEFVLVDNVESVSESIHIELEKKIRGLMTDKTPFIIIKSTSLFDILGTEVERIPNCLLESNNFNYSPTDSGAVFPKMSIQQVRLSVVEETEMVNATPALIPKARVADKQQVAQAQAEASTTKPNDPNAKNPNAKNPNVKESGNTDNSTAKDLTLAANAREEELTKLGNAMEKRADQIEATGKNHSIERNNNSNGWDVVPTSR